MAIQSEACKARQVARARMERRIAAGMDPDTLWGLGSRQLAGVRLEDDDDEEDGFEAGAGGPRVDGALEEDSVAGMRMEDFGGASMGVDMDAGEFARAGGTAAPEFAPDGVISNKEACLFLVNMSCHESAQEMHADLF